MRRNLGFAIGFGSITLLFGTVVYLGLDRYFEGTTWRWIFAIETVFVLAGIIQMGATMMKIGIKKPLLNIFTGYTFASIVFRFVGGLLLIIPFLVSLVVGSEQFPAVWFLITLVPAALLMIALLFGVFFGKYHYKVRRIPLHFKELPPAFDGFKIIQLSDIHSGSFDSVKGVMKGIQLVNREKGDLILFTGDLVNFDPREFGPWRTVFKKLEAELGVYSITGNHDYYFDQNLSGYQNSDGWKALLENHKAANFQLLLNEKVKISRAEQSIIVAGVENWGEPPFPQLGNLKEALNGCSPGDFIVLMSHDPSHWKAQVLQNENQINLTLSGHTHGMQFGLELGKWKWSPVQWRYKEWAGLYRKANQFLYVNRGFGFIGYPGRFGIRPEITVLELHSVKST